MFLRGLLGLVLQRSSALPAPRGSRWNTLGVGDFRSQYFYRAGTGEHCDAVVIDLLDGAQYIAELFT